MHNKRMMFVILVLALIAFACGQISAPTPLTPTPETVLLTKIVTVEVTRIVPRNTPTRINKVVERGSNLPIPRSQHTATLMDDGRILLAGGSIAPDEFTAEVDVFDPSNGSVRSAAPLNTGRHGHSAALLKDGRVLVVAGYNAMYSWLTDAEIYDPVRDTWTVIQPLYPHGVGHTATQMKNGDILIVGGCIGSGVCTERVEIFNPATNSWRPAASLPSDRASHAAVLLQDGRVLLIGGGSAAGVPMGGDALVYDPVTDSWMSTAPMVTPRLFTQGILLRDGRVLVAGGTALSDPTNETMVRGTELFDPTTMTWSAAADLNETRYGHAMVLLPDGGVLVVGGAQSYSNMDPNSYQRQIEVYNAAMNRWAVIGKLPFPRVYLTATLLPDGRVWMAGGQFLNRSRRDTFLILAQ